MARKGTTVGIIAEDDSDVDSLKIIFKKIRRENFGFKHSVGDGCGKISRKCHDWATDLKSRGCSSLILVHDSDKKNPEQLRDSLISLMSECAINSNVVIVPVQELEAWLLSDPEAIQKGMNLRKLPKITGNVERINDPKEYLAEVIFKYSDKEKDYLNTKHNDKMFMHINVQNLLKCNSFKPLYKFIKELRFK